MAKPCCERKKTFWSRAGTAKGSERGPKSTSRDPLLNRLTLLKTLGFGISLLNRLTLLKTLGFGVAYLEILSFANGNSRDPERKVSRNLKSPIFEPKLTLCTGFWLGSWRTIEESRANRLLATWTGSSPHLLVASRVLQQLMCTTGVCIADIEWVWCVLRGWVLSGAGCGVQHGAVCCANLCGNV